MSERERVEGQEPEGAGETLLAGKYKTLQELETAYLNAQSALTKQNQALSNTRGFLNQYGYQVGDDGQVIPPEITSEVTTPPIQAEPEWSSAGEERLAKELAELKATVGGMVPVLETTTRGMAEPDKAKLLTAVPPDQREAAAGKWNAMVGSLQPAQRNPQNLSFIRKAIVGELAEARGSWWEAQATAENPNRDASNAALDEGGGVERPGGERSTRPGPSSLLNREVQTNMAAVLNGMGIKVTAEELAAEADKLERERRR